MSDAPQPPDDSVPPDDPPHAPLSRPSGSWSRISMELQRANDVASQHTASALLDPKSYRRLRLGFAVVVLGIALWVIIIYLRGDSISAEAIEAVVDRFGVVAPIAFIGLFAIVGCLVVPTTVLTIAGATLFGRGEGFAYSVLGAFFAAMIGFSAARTLGRQAVSGWLNKSEGRLARLDERLEQNGFTTALFMRLVYIPNGVINILCGVSSIPYRVYAVATFFGLLPLVFAVAFMTTGLTEAFFRGNWDALLQTETVLAASLFLACVSIPLIVSKIRKRRQAG